jgi:4-amino-4-deoxy-L-arabinose transferase-like glycosyltransferase
MFRFDNPDALLVLLLVAGAYATVRAIDAVSVRASTWWLVAAGAAVGFGFLTKMGQALLVVPAFGLAYLVAGPTRLRTRLLQLLAALGSMIVSAGWFVALVELWPADSRPYIGGSTTNSLLELALGYNGLGRILGGSGNGGGGDGFGGGNSGFGGEAGILRLFTDELGLEISWLLPAALIALVAYYTVALAPGVAALVGMGAHALWARRDSLLARGTLALTVAATAAWSFTLLASSAESFAWIRWVVAGLAVPAVAGLLVGAGRLRRVALVGVVAAVLTGLAGTSAYAVATASVAHTGSIPSVGATSSAMGGGPRGMGGEAGTNTELTALLTATDGTWSAAVATSQTAASLELVTGTAVMSTGGWGGSDSAVTLEQFQAYVASGQISYYVGGGQGGGPGRADSDSTSGQIAEWVAANYPATTVGGQTVYDLQG